MLGVGVCIKLFFFNRTCTFLLYIILYNRFFIFRALRFSDLILFGILLFYSDSTLQGIEVFICRANYLG